MPTSLPPRKDPSPPVSEPGFRNLMVAAVLLAGVLGLVCEQKFGPTPGYSLADSASALQLSP
jgi:hypothetical protein